MLARLPRLVAGFRPTFHPCLRRVEQGWAARGAAAPLSCGSSSSRSEGMRAHGPSGSSTLLPGKTLFPGMQENPTSCPPKHLGPEALPPIHTHTGTAVSLPWGKICSGSNKEEQFLRPEVHAFGFALSLVPC